MLEFLFIIFFGGVGGWWYLTTFDYDRCLLWTPCKAFIITDMCFKFLFEVMIRSAFDNIEIFIQTDFAQF